MASAPIKLIALLFTLAALSSCEEKIDYKTEETGRLAIDIDQDIKTARAQNTMPLAATTFSCSNCHALERKHIGPAWKEIGKRYQNATSYEFEGRTYPLTEGLVQKVSRGGGGIWGIDAMPAMDPGGRKHKEIGKLVQFILELNKPPR